MLCRSIVFTVLPYHLCQVIASQLDSDYMIHTILDRFHVLDLLTFSPSTTVNARRKVVLSRDHELPMLESALTFLCMLLGERTKLGTAAFYCLIFAIFAISVAFLIINYGSRSVLSGFYSISLSLQVDNIWTVMIVWRIRSKSIGTVVCCQCAQ